MMRLVLKAMLSRQITRQSHRQPPQSTVRQCHRKPPNPAFGTRAYLDLHLVPRHGGAVPLRGDHDDFFLLLERGGRRHGHDGQGGGLVGERHGDRGPAAAAGRRGGRGDVGGVLPADAVVGRVPLGHGSGEVLEVLLGCRHRRGRQGRVVFHQKSKSSSSVLPLFAVGTCASRLGLRAPEELNRGGLDGPDGEGEHDTGRRAS